MKKKNYIWCLVFLVYSLFLIMASRYLVTEEIKKNYIQTHEVATDDEIEIYEYVFSIPCDSTCYH